MRARIIGDAYRMRSSSAHSAPGGGMNLADTAAVRRARLRALAFGAVFALGFLLGQSGRARSR